MADDPTPQPAGYVALKMRSWIDRFVDSVTRDPSTGVLGAAANPRGMQGYAIGR